MNKVKFLMFAVVATLAAACVEDPKMDGSAQGEVAVATKIVNTSENAAKGELVLYVDDATAEQWSVEKAITRSSDSALAAIAQEVGAESVEQVFNMAMNADVKRARGMHRWFVVKFDQEANLDVVAQKFAELPSVSKIQFSTTPKRPQAAARPVKEVMPITRADEMPYNDPMLTLQWHYDNRGSKSISQTAKEGEDIGAFGAWQYTAGNREVVVAVVAHQILRLLHLGAGEHHLRQDAAVLGTDSLHLVVRDTVHSHIAGHPALDHSLCVGQGVVLFKSGLMAVIAAHGLHQDKKAIVHDDSPLFSLFRPGCIPASGLQVPV